MDNKTKESGKFDQQYKKDWLKNRKIKRNAKKNGKTDQVRNLQFFDTALSKMNLSYRKVSELTTGISPQRISWWIASDDCNYKTMVSLFEQLNVTLSCAFKPINPNSVNEQISNCSVNLENIPEFGKKEKKTSSVLNDVIYSKGTLAWLAKFIKKQSRTLVDFCNTFNIEYYTLYYCFKKDDIKISRLYEIAQKTQHQLVWSFVGKDTE